MNKKRYKSILNLTSADARNFFLRSDNYFSGNLPPYFHLSNLLEDAQKILETNEIDNKNHLFSISKYSTVSGINYTLLMNKTSNSYRPLTLIHPYLYLDLVNCLTESKNWSFIIDRFNELYLMSKGKVFCHSVPFVTDSEKSDKKEKSLHFWNSIEQNSIKLSLNYSYITKVDINNFYSSIYTHTIPWACYGESEAKSRRNEKQLIGNKLDVKIQSMNYGETVGLPQGNLVSDFIAELLLAYIDSLLTEKIKDIDCKILRYRDDYRIFTINNTHANLIKKELALILQRHKLSLGESKTESSSDIINDAIKKDKAYWIEHDPVIKLTSDKIYTHPEKWLKRLMGKNVNSLKFRRFFNKHIGHNRIYKATIQKHLYQIKWLADNYPNSGQLIGALDEFENRISNFSYKDFEKVGTSINVLVAIIVNIVENNPKIIQIGIKLLSVLFSKLNLETFVWDWEDIQFSKLGKKNVYEIKTELLQQVLVRLNKKGYSPYLEIWAQRLIVKNACSGSEIIDTFYDTAKNELVQLCFEVYKNNSTTIQLFNQDWLKKEYRIDERKLINTEIIKNLNDIVQDHEIQLFEYEA